MFSRFNNILILLGGILVALLVVGGCGNSSDSPTPVEPDNPFELAKVGTDSTFEVMTWNLEHFAKENAITTGWVIQAVKGVDVDIIALQEINSDFRFQAVVDGLDGWSGFKANSAGYDTDLAFLYRTDGLLEMVSIQELMTDLWIPFPRSPLLFQGTFNGQSVAVINNHLKCCGDGVLEADNDRDEETRRRDACLLLEDYVLDNLNEHRVYLVGDFNDVLTDPAENNVFANFLGDPHQWLVADLPIAEGGASGWSFPGWPSHIDHIIVNQPLFEAHNGPDTEVLVVPLPSFMPNGWLQYDQEISDHLPVVLKLKL